MFFQNSLHLILITFVAHQDLFSVSLMPETWPPFPFEAVVFALNTVFLLIYSIISAWRCHFLWDWAIFILKTEHPSFCFRILSFILWVPAFSAFPSHFRALTSHLPLSKSRSRVRWAYRHYSVLESALSIYWSFFFVL